MLTQGVVFDPSSAASADGSTVTGNYGRANEALVAELHGKYFEQCYRGNVYYCSSATAGVVIPISSTLTPVYTIWNPAGSGKLCCPVVSVFGHNATTSVLGGLVWMATTNAGSAIGTAAPIVSFTNVGPINANLGSGKVASTRFATSASTLTIIAAPTIFRHTGVTVAANTVATATAGWVWRDEWDGGGIIPPGNAIHLMGTTAVALTLNVTTVFVEVPV